MQEILEVICRRKQDPAWTPAELMGALEQAATDHAEDLNIGHDRMAADFGCLWMLVRSRLELDRLPAPEEALTVRTWLRRPSAVVSVRDYDFLSGGQVIGRAVHSWVLADAEERRLVDLRKIAPLWSLPTPQPERRETLRRLLLPQAMSPTGGSPIVPEEIDDNGHMNNVAYVRRAQAGAPEDCTGLEVVYDHECFLRELLSLETASAHGSYFVRGVKGAGEESFRMRFYQAGGDQP